MDHRRTTLNGSGADRGGSRARPDVAEPPKAGATARHRRGTARRRHQRSQPFRRHGATTRRRRGAARPALRLVCVGVLLAAGAAAQAQDGDRFGGRLSIVPVDFATRPNVSGSGEAEAVLDGRILTVSGTFEGLSSPAAAAHLHRAPPARRGPAVFALEVTEAAAGRVEGEIELDDAQVEALRRGGYYVQVATRNNPDGEIRGWLLPRAEGGVGEAAEAGAEQEVEQEAEPGTEQEAAPGADAEQEAGAGGEREAGTQGEADAQAGPGAEVDAEPQADAAGGADAQAGANGDEPADAAAPIRYLADQARTGEAAYRNVCASCHQADLSGGFDTPELAGPAFRSLWSGRPVRDLLGYIEAAMPPAGRQPDEATRAAIVAYILRQNGAEAGGAPLSAASQGMIGP